MEPCYRDFGSVWVCLVECDEIVSVLYSLCVQVLHRGGLYGCVWYKCRLSVVNFVECVVWWLCLLCVLVAVWCCEELLCLVCACECGICGVKCILLGVVLP